jgi:hypothetical protein
LQEKFHYDNRISICCDGNFSCLTVNTDDVKFYAYLPVGNYCFLWQEWADDKIESEIDIVLDTVNKLRSLKPPTDTNERCVYGCLNGLSLYSIYYAWYIPVFSCCWLAKTMSYCVFSHEQATCFCTLPRTRYCCHCSIVSISSRVSFFRIIAQGFCLIFLII